MKAKFVTLFMGMIFILGIGLGNALVINSVFTNPAEVQPGEKISVELAIENNLNEDIENVVISLDLSDVPFSPYQSSNQISLDKIKEDKEKEVEFELIADSDAESGAYKIPVKISYLINDSEKESSGLIGLIVKANPNLELSSESILIKGRNSNLNIKITNSGLGDAKLLSLKIKNVVGIKVIGSNKAYIGDIDSDDFDTAEFKISVNENAPSTINLPVEIAYKDSRNNEIKENKQISLRIYTEQEAIELGLIKKSNILNIVLGLGILIVLFIIYRKLRKVLKKRRLEKEVK